jgi:para-aminobenzoate synthetase component I
VFHPWLIVCQIRVLRVIRDKSCGGNELMFQSMTTQDSGESQPVAGDRSMHETCTAVMELVPAPDAEDVFQRLAGLPHCLYLDSARRDSLLGRYSFVAADPFDFIEVPVSTDRANSRHDDAFALVERQLGGFATTAIAGLPPFQGGAAGLFSYELAHQLERLPTARFDEFQVPAMAISLYDVVVAFDHATDRAWIISQGFPEIEPGRRRKRAIERLERFRNWLDVASADGERRANGSARAESPVRPALAKPVVHEGQLSSNFSAEEYLAVVRRAIEYIHAGDVFQVNLAQRLLHPAIDDSISLYLRLRRRNPATFGGYIDLGAFQIASASPERFLQVHGGDVEARPIKGTRRRTARPEADLFAGDELRESEKDNAENVMIVDLLRNDLSRVCRPESVVVSDLCRLETYEFVQHLVSVVRGRLREGVTSLGVLRAAFPGGSITGAPKVRAMEIVAELEPTARGPYCGALGYIGFDGAMDTNILIRTITAGRGWWQMPVGGGIVAQSEPQSEYDETWHKAEGLLRALR